MKPSENAIKARGRLLGALQDELKRGDVTKHELLAILAHCVGTCIAMQDQRETTPGQAMEIVGANIEQGNQEAVDELMATGGVLQ